APNGGAPRGAHPGDVHRKLLVALLEARAIPLVEDDAGGELHFDGSRPRPVKACERAGQVLLCGSVSKTLGPGLRIGWIAPGRHRAPVVAQQAASSGSPGEIGAPAVGGHLGPGGHAARESTAARRTRGRSVPAPCPPTWPRAATSCTCATCAGRWPCRCCR